MLSEIDVDVCLQVHCLEARKGMAMCRKFDASESRNVGFEPPMVKEIIFGRHMQGWQIAHILSCTDASR